MKQSKLLISVLITVTVFVMAIINISYAPGGTGSAAKTDSAVKTDGAGKQELVNKKTDNTIGFIGLGFSVLNSIGLATLFWLNRQKIGEIEDNASNLKVTIATQERKVGKIDKLIEDVKKIGESGKSLDKTNKEVEGLKQSVAEISRKAASIQQPTPIPQSNHRTERYSQSERYAAAPVNIQLSPTDYYNNRQSDFQNKYQITPVSREAENLNQSLAAQTDSVVLAGDRQGNYWLFSDNSEIYSLPSVELDMKRGNFHE